MAGTQTARLGGQVSQAGETGELQQELQVAEGLYERNHFQTEAVTSGQYIIYLLYREVLPTTSSSQSENTKSQESPVVSCLSSHLN